MGRLNPGGPLNRPAWAKNGHMEAIDHCVVANRTLCDFFDFVLFGSLINKGPWDVVNTKAFTIE
jgi:hypothetical protein